MYSTFALRILEERGKKGLRQDELAQILSERLNRKHAISPSTVSTWERGSRYPSIEILIAITQYFNCTIDYLLGNVDYRQSLTEPPTNPKITKKTSDIEGDLPVEIADLKKYNKKPLFVVFKNLLFSSQWGIYNADTGVMHFADMSKNISELLSCEFYTSTPLFAHTSVNYSRPCNYLRLMSLNMFRVVSNSEDPIMREKYSGVFRHNEDKTCLINEKGITLPYEGLGVSYEAYFFK